MFISVKVKEVNKTIIKINPKNSFEDDNIMSNKKSEIINYNFLDGNYFVNYAEGFCILKCNYELAEKCTDIIDIKGEYIHISLLASGSFKVINQGVNKPLNIQNGILRFAYFNKHNVEMEMSAVDEKLHYTRIFLSKKFYLALLENEKWAKKDYFFNEVKNDRFVDFEQFDLPMNYIIIELLNEITDNKHQGLLGYYYLVSKLQELFLMAHIIKSEINLPNTLKTDELEKLAIAKVYLENNYNEAPTIKQLSRMVLLNEFKLKNGFKEIYKCTIHNYTLQLRMEKAKKMLLEELSVNEVSAALGYKSISHFIVYFKKYFGVTPKQLVVSDLFNETKPL